MSVCELDRKTHQYFVDGIKFDGPFPTKVLADLKLSRDYTGVNDYYAERGNAVHLACDILNRAQELDPATLDEDVVPFIDAYRVFLKETGFEPIESELSLHSGLHDFCCTLDVIGRYKDEITLIDLKTSRSLDPAVELQLGAQQVAWEENNRLKPIVRRMALSLRQDGTYSLKDCTHISPYLWLDALKLWRWMMTHRRTKK